MGLILLRYSLRIGVFLCRSSRFAVKEVHLGNGKWLWCFGLFMFIDAAYNEYYQENQKSKE